MKKRNYIPNKTNKEQNLIVLGKKINNLQFVIEKNKQLGEQKYRALQDFVRLLTNFASHDIKNAIHNMDGLLSTIDPKDLNEENIDSLKGCLDNIRSSLKEFKILSSDVEKGDFKLRELESSLQSLHRPLFKREKVTFKVEYLNLTKDTTVHQSFHPILQIFNNLLINAFEFLEGSDKKEITLTFEKNNKEKSSINVTISDTGVGIPTENKDKIFAAYFTTKEGGSGVGLAHVKYILDEIDGEINLVNNNSYFSTVFNIKLPLGI